MTTAQELYEQAFGYPRDARSEEYRQGVKAAIRYWMGETRTLGNAYELGTAQADAFFSGCEEGSRIVRQHHACAEHGLSLNDVRLSDRHHHQS